MAMRALNRKAETLTAAPPDDARPYTFGDCCPGFLPGWEVGEQGAPDPCGWQNDLPACHPCYWSAQVPDNTTYPGWLNACGNIAQDWDALPRVGP
jgi:hypothetical protein